MKHRITLILVGMLCFAIGWWARNMQQSAPKVIDDRQHLQSLESKDSLGVATVTEKEATKPKKKRIRDYALNDEFNSWKPRYSDTSGYSLKLSLQDITAEYWFHGQCVYDYFTYTTSDTTVEVLWSYRIDCLLDMNFLEKPNAVKSYPKKGEKFATLTLINDTTLQAKYEFPEWTKKVNEIAGVSIFPTFYYLENPNSHNL